MTLTLTRAHRTATKPPSERDQLIAHIRADLVDGYDEALEMEIEDRAVDEALSSTTSEGEQSARRGYFRNLFALQRELVKVQD